MNTNKISTLEMSITDVNSEYLGVKRNILMENAGRGLSDFIKGLMKSENITKVKIFAGKGGNGGDGMVAARHLCDSLTVDLYLLGAETNIKKRSTLTNWEILKKLDNSIHLHSLITREDIDNINFDDNCLIVDALLGTGIRGKIRNPLLHLITKINMWHEKGSIVVSADTPTGINPDTGEYSNSYIKADWTVCFHKQKTGLNNDNAGKIIVKSIGIPPEAEYTMGPGDLLALKRYDAWSKKGNKGKILIIGGNELYSGAPTLAALGAIQAGADLVTIFVPTKIAYSIRAYSPELIVRDYDEPHLTKKYINDDYIRSFDVILIGPGLGNHTETKEAVQHFQKIVNSSGKYVVYDADALKLLDKSRLTHNSVLTPHAGEFALLTGVELPSGQPFFANRKQLIYNAVKELNGVWVIKGHWDVVTDGVTLKINKTGTNKMTRGGTGDVLAGLISGLIPQVSSLVHAAYIGTYINGRAGELAQEEFSLSKLLEFIPKAINESYNFIRSD
ncbi:MAG: NAD(P)H-hydrate dehydratase [Candidatus Hodarchaeales archaeon]